MLETALHDGLRYPAQPRHGSTMKPLYSVTKVGSLILHKNAYEAWSAYYSLMGKVFGSHKKEKNLIYFINTNLEAVLQCFAFFISNLSPTTWVF